MSAALIVMGLSILAVTLVDIFVTVLTTRGAGPVTGRMTSLIWRGLLALQGKQRPHVLLGVAGPLIAVLTVIGWIVLVWAGWFLVFAAGETPVVKDGSGVPAGPLTILYFVGYTLFTLGLGDYRPDGDVWKLLTTVVAGNGFLILSLSASYLIPLLSAATTVRSTALQVRTLGATPAGMVVAAWDGTGFGGLESRLTALIAPVIHTGQQHLAYPVLHHFQSSDKRAALSVQLVRLDEMISILKHGVAPEMRPSAPALDALARAIGFHIEVLQRSQVEEDRPPPPPPSLEAVARAGIPVVPRSEFDRAMGAQQARRRDLREVLSHGGWNWSHAAGQSE